MEDICNYFITGITDTPLQNHKRQWHSSLAVLAVSAEHKEICYRVHGYAKMKSLITDKE